MRTPGISKLDEESMEHEHLPTHTLASYAQQVSFPNWNAMVGDLGQKFARRSSFEKEIPTATVEVEDVTDFLPKTGRSLDQNINPLREKTKITENLSNFQEKHGDSLDGQKGIDGLAHDSTYSNEDHCKIRRPIVRYCGMIKEDSQESDEEPIVDREESAPSKIHISTVSIMLKSSKGRKRQENHENNKLESRDNSRKKEDNDGETTEETGQRGNDDNKGSLDEEKSKVHDERDTIDDKKESKGEYITLFSTTNIEGGKRYEKDATEEAEKVFKKSGNGVRSANNMDEKKLKRTGAMDDRYLKPDYTTAQNKSLGTKHQSTFRKKSSSFSGALPLSFSTDKEETRAETTDDVDKRKMLQRRRGTVDVGRVEPQKSPVFAKENHHHNHHHQKLDPSHYLMHGGKRRGSFNPTYNQCNTTMHKNRRNNTARAKSLFICNTDERVALRERLMKHASPELRESLESEDGVLKTQSNCNAGINGDKHSTDVQRRPLRKSISFDSRPPIMENAQEVEDFYERLKHSDNLIGSHRSGSRKTGIIPSPTMRSKEPPTTILETREVETTILTKNGGLFGDSRFSKPRGRQVRAHSNFVGVPSMYLGRLRDKSMDHPQVTRSQSDSISSVSSSEGGDSVDPFPMHTAVKNGRQKRLNKLVSKGMDVNTRDADGWPPIHYALSAGNFEIVAFLLKAGANITDYTKGRTSKYFK